MSSSERNSFVATLVREFGLASEEVLAETMEQYLSDSSDAAHSPDASGSANGCPSFESSNLEELLLQNEIISLEQKERLSQIAAALDRVNENGEAGSVGSNEITLPLSTRNNYDNVVTPQVWEEPNRNGDTNGAASLNGVDKTTSSNKSRFRILRPFAQGGLGSISVAHDSELSRVVALKEIQPKYSESRESRHRFLFEGQVTGQLEHPGIVPVYSLGSGADGKPFYAMRLINGTSMRDEIKDFFEIEYDDRKSTLIPWLRRMIGRLNDACMAIEFAHNRSVIHRDLKPSNIMLGNFGETLVVDWGLAKSLSEPKRNWKVDEEAGDRDFQPASLNAKGTTPHHTRTGSVIGTIGYMSPEQAAGEHDQVGKSSDVFCLGATLYAVITGQAPYGENCQLSDVTAGNFPTPRTIRQEIPKNLEAICLKAMAADPTQRYASPRALAEDLENWNADQPILARPEPVLDRLGRWLRKYRTAAVASFIGLVAISGGMFAYNSAIKDKNQVIQQSNTDLSRSLAVARESSMKLLEDSESKMNMNPQQRVSILDNVHQMYTKIYELNPNDDQLNREYARVLKTSANALRFQGDRNEPVERYKKAVDLLVGLTKGQSGNNASEDVLSLIAVQTDLASHLIKQGQIERAEKVLLEAMTIVDGLSGVTENELVLNRVVALASAEQMDVYSKRLEWGKYFEASERAKNSFEKYIDSPLFVPVDSMFYLKSLYGMGTATFQLNKKNEALKFFEQANLYGEKMLAENPDRNNRFAMSCMLLRYTEAIMGNSNDPKRLDDAERIVNRWRYLASLNANQFPEMIIYQSLKLDAFRNEAKILVQRNELDKASQILRDTKKQFEPLLKNYVYSWTPIFATKCWRDLAMLENTEIEERKTLLRKALVIIDLVINESKQDLDAFNLKSELVQLLKEIEPDN